MVGYGSHSGGGFAGGGVHNLQPVTGVMPSSMPKGIGSQYIGPPTFDDKGNLTDQGRKHIGAMDYYLGVAPGNYDLSKPEDQDRIEHYDLPYAFKEGMPKQNQMMRQIVIAIITHRECDLMTTFLPRLQVANLAEHTQWTEWVFNDTLPDTLPHEGVPRMLTMCERTSGFMFKRIGKMFQIEYGFWQTEMGHCQYVFSLQQIANCIVEYSNLDAAVECLSAQYTDPNLSASLLHNPDGYNFEQLMDQEAAQKFRIQKNPECGFDDLIDDFRREYNMRGVPNGNVRGIALPFGMTQYIKRAKAYVPFLFTGVRAGLEWDIVTGNDSSGKYVYVESRGIRIGDSLPPLDPFYSLETIGTFWTVTAAHFHRPLGNGTYRNSMLTADVFNISANESQPFKFSDAIGGSGLYYDWNSDRPRGSEYLDKYLDPGTNTYYDWYKSNEGGWLLDTVRTILINDFIDNTTNSTLVALNKKINELSTSKKEIRNAYDDSNISTNWTDEWSKYQKGIPTNKRRRDVQQTVPAAALGSAYGGGGGGSDASRRLRKVVKMSPPESTTKIRTRADVEDLVNEIMRSSPTATSSQSLAASPTALVDRERSLASIQVFLDSMDAITRAYNGAVGADHLSNRTKYMWTLIYDNIREWASSPSATSPTSATTQSQIAPRCWAIVSADLLALDLDTALQTISENTKATPYTGIEKTVVVMSAKQTEPSFDDDNIKLTALADQELDKSPQFDQSDLAVLSVYQGASFASTVPLELASLAFTYSTAYITLFALTGRQVELISAADGGVKMNTPKAMLPVEWGVGGQRRMALCQYSLCLSALLAAAIRDRDPSQPFSEFYAHLLTLVPLKDSATGNSIQQTIATASAMKSSPSQSMFEPVIDILEELFAALGRFKSQRSVRDNADNTDSIYGIVSRLSVACDAVGSYPIQGATRQVTFGGTNQTAATGAMGVAGNTSSKNPSPQWIADAHKITDSVQTAHNKIVQAHPDSTAGRVSDRLGVARPFEKELAGMLRAVKRSDDSELGARIFTANIELLDAIYRLREDAVNAFLPPLNDTRAAVLNTSATPEQFEYAKSKDVVSALLDSLSSNPLALIVDLNNSNPGVAQFTRQKEWTTELLTTGRIADSAVSDGLRAAVDRYLEAKDNLRISYVTAQGTSGAATARAYYRKPKFSAASGDTIIQLMGDLGRADGLDNKDEAIKEYTDSVSVGNHSPRSIRLAAQAFVSSYNQRHPRNTITLANLGATAITADDAELKVEYGDDDDDATVAGGADAPVSTVAMDVDAGITPALTTSLATARGRLDVLSVHGRTVPRTLIPQNEISFLADSTLRDMKVAEGVYLKMIIQSDRVPPPVGYIGRNPFIVIEKGDAFMCATNGAAGNSYHGREVLMLGDDPLRMTHTCVWAGYTKAKIIKPKLLIQRRAIICRRVVEGATFDIQDPLNPTHITQLTGGGLSGDVFIAPVPFTWESKSTTHVMTGVIAAEFRPKPFEQLRAKYPGCELQCDIWKLDNATDSHYVTSQTFMNTLRMASNMRSNVICRRIQHSFDQGVGVPRRVVTDATPFAIKGTMENGSMNKFDMTRPTPIDFTVPVRMVA